MRMPRAAERPADRSTVRWAFDVLVMLFAGTSALPNLFHDHRHPSAAEVLALALVVLPLSVRRIWPVPVFAWVVLAAGAVGLWNNDVVPGFALLIALYTIAAAESRRVALGSAAVLEAATIAAVVKFDGTNWWSDGIFLSGMVAAAGGLGLYTATRRAYLLELRDRAARLERERDQQGALAAAAERARIAREMHDIVAHHLTVMVALSDGAIAASARSPERAGEAMRAVSATGRRALTDTRRLLGVLRGATFDDEGGSRQPIPDLAELDVLIERVRAAGLPTTLEVHGAVSDVPAGVQLTVYRLVQEALTNTLKHGGSGTRAAVRLRHLPGELQVQVDDDGAGVAAPATAGVGGGLAGMQERIHAYGGDIESGPRRPGGGWRVSARLRVDETGDP